MAIAQNPRFTEELLGRAKPVKLLMLDCDGVLTDGKIYFLPNPAGGLFETKSFHTQDGIAYKWARENGIDTGIISGRASPAVEERARTAGMKYLYEGSTEKAPLFEEVLQKSGLSTEQIAYVGDDLTDVPILKRVGLAVAPKNARDEVKARVHLVSNRDGGQGVVRDVMELILTAQGRWEHVLAHYGLTD